MKGKGIKVRVIKQILFDILAVILSTYFSLLVRYGFAFSEIPKQYLMIARNALAFNFLITIIVFSLFHLYSNVQMNFGRIGCLDALMGCIISAIVSMLHILLVNRRYVCPMPRSYYFLYGICLLFGTLISRCLAHLSQKT